MASSYTIPVPTYIGCKAKHQMVQRGGGAIAPNALDWLRAWVQNNFGRALLLQSRDGDISSLGAAVQHNFRRTLLVPSREENISSLCTVVLVQHNFRRALLLPSRDRNINSLGAAVQHNFRRTLLLPSREENINRLGAAAQHNFRCTLLVPSSAGKYQKPVLCGIPTSSNARSKIKVAQGSSCP